jgi:group I intron endonuclease
VKKYTYSVETDKKQTRYIVYKITFPNNKLYVGMTSQPMNKRICEHIYHSRKRRNMVVARAINKYGIQNIYISIIDYADSYDELKLFEQKWISLFDKNRLYNTTKGGDGILGKRYTKKELDNIRVNCGARYFKVFDIYRHFYGEWINISECERDLGLKSISVKRYFIDKKVYINKYIFIYSNEYNDEVLSERISTYFAPKITNDIILVYCKNGKYVGQYNTQKECANQLDIPQSPNISKCLNDKMPSYKGYIFIYKNNFSNELLQYKLSKTVSYYNKEMTV